ncbi:AAA family ATPase [Enterococcus sp. BWB1-3]|uniref:AAA family ATPase n=1 Tax=Enterococcus sp. CWB-B31 TaxID=2885159 RepID=UPI0019250426|nr:AAA family ATPase [Enterococcus sp. CWB-B31]MBL1229761.1 AAA family ATPase [Enterococcus sp. BWB1-3]MCB5956259.1 AAA family ATPase [Enterococcus sp. CWB-B31]
MKPLTLKLKNFGPYIDETVDFTNFEESSLFLISGKTGSGKTTIFDGMSYALFGESSGKIRQGKELRSTFADPSEPTQVQLLFSHGEFFYVVTRSPEQELYKKRGEGTRTQSAKISLIIKGADGKELREYTKRREVDAFIQELLHLDADQFSQIVLLPQGDFRTFLIANSSEKEKVLRKLFGTQIYQALGEELKQQSNNRNQEINQTRQKIEMKMEQVYWEEERTDIEELLTEQKLVLLADQQKQVKSMQQRRFEELTELKHTIKNIEQEKYRLEEQLKLIQKQKELKLEQEQLSEKEEEQKKAKQKEQELLWAATQENLIDSIEEQESSLLEKEQQYKEAIETKNEIDGQSDSLQKEADQLAELKEEMGAKQMESNRLTSKLPLYEEKEKMEKELSEINLLTLEDQLNHKKEEYQQLTDQLQLVQEKINQLPNIEKEQLLHTQRIKDWKQMVEKWQSFQKEILRIENNKEQLLLLNEQIEAVEQKLEFAAEDLKNKRNQSIKIQINRLSLLLEDGEPCPVCGAVDHPSQKQYHEVSLDEVQKAEKDLELAEKSLKELEEQQTTLQLESRKLLEETTAAEKEISQQEEYILEEVFLFSNEKMNSQNLTEEWWNEREHQLNSKEAEFERLFSDMEKHKKEAAIFAETLETSQAEMKGLDEAYLKKYSEQQVLQGKIETILGQLDDKMSLDECLQKLEVLKSERDKWLCASEKIAKQLDEHKSAKQETKHRIQTLAEGLAEDQKKIEKAKQKLEMSMKLRGVLYTSEELSELLQELATLPELQIKIAAYEEKKKEIQFQLREIEQQIETVELSELTEIEEQYQRTANEIAEKEERYYQIKEKMSVNEVIQQEVSAAAAAIDKKWEEVAALQQLSETVNGNNPKKTSLERYVLQTYLTEVLKTANSRMAVLTNSRYQFELNKEKNSFRSQTGLEINIYDDNAGASRSARTLSGGESFIAALALALSLAEVIQEQAGGVLIEALFIDEGFGSLDEEALEMAIEALETIENEGRMIGIISHVTELKSRISQQMRINTNGVGQSSVGYQMM